MANDYLENYLEKKKQEQEGQQSQPSGGNASYLDAWKRSWTQKNGERIGNDLVNRVNSWISKVNSFGDSFTARQKQYGESYQGDASAYLHSVMDQRHSLIAEEKEIRELLKKYSGVFDAKWIKELDDVLTSGSAAHANVLMAAERNKKYWQQFSSQNDYDWYRKYSPMSMEELYSTLGGLEVGSEEYNYVHSRASYNDDWLKEDGVTTVENSAARQARYKHNTDTVAKLTAEYDALYEERKKIEYQMNFGTPEHAARVNEVESRMKQIKAQIDALSAENNRYSQGQGKVDSYFGLTQNDDFADTPRVYDNITREELDRWDDIHNGTPRTNGDGKLVDIAGNVIDDNWIGYQQPVIEDKLGMFLATDQDTRLQAYDEAYEGTWATVIRDGVYRDWDKLTKDEIGIYYYLLAHEGRDSAYQFLDSMTSELNRRTTAEMAERIQNANGWEKFAWNIASVPANVLGGGMAFIDDTINTIKGEEINPYSKWHSAQNAGQTVRSATAEDINRLTNAGESDAYTWGEVYQSIMSGVDSLAGAMTFGSGYTVLMGMGAASAEAKELYERGASKEQIAWGGVLAGAAELVFEKVSIDHFFDNILAGGTKSGAQLIRNLLIQGGVEASEEMLTEIANTITDAMVMGSRSEFEQSIQEYMEQGYTRAEASSLAVQKVGKNVWKSGIGGLISGGFMGGGASAAQYGSYKAEVKDTGRTIMSADGGVDALKNLANQVAGVSEDTKVNGKLTKQLSKVDKKATAKNVGNLYNTVQTANDLANADANQADIAKSLQRKGFGADTAKDIAGALVARYNGQELTRHQEKLLKAVEGNEVVSKAVSDIMANEKSTMGQRSQNIRDFQSDIALGTAINTMAKQHTEKAFTPEGKYAVSSRGEATAMVTEEVDGKTVTKDSGEVIDIKGIKEIHNGRMLLDIGDGKTIDAKNVAYANQGEALVYEAIANLGDNIDADTANKLMAKFDGGNAMVFARGIAQAYTYGFYGLDRAEMRGKHTLSAELTEAQRNEAYALGEKYRPVKDAKDKAAAKATKASGEKGVYYRDKDGKTTDIRTHLDNTKIGLKDVQKTAIEVMEKMSQMMGVRFNVFESWVENGKRYYLDENGVKTEGNPNGFYDTRTGEIYIDLNAGNDYQGTMLFTIAHELTHFMRQWSPEHFTKIAKIVFQHGGVKGDVSKLVALKQAKAKARGKPISYDTAMEEVVADGMETILKDGKVLEFMEDVKKKDHTAWEKIKEWFQNFAAFLREMVSAYSGQSAQTVEGAKVAEFSSQLLNQIEQIWAEGAVAAGESYQAAKENVTDAKAEKNTAPKGGVVLHMSRDVATVTEETVRADLTDVFNGNNVVANSYIPISKTTPFALRYITGQTTDLPMIVEKKKAYFDMRENGKFKEDSNHHYHGMGVDGFLQAMDILEDPEYAIREEMKNGSVHYAFITTNEDGEEVCIAFQMAVYKPEYTMNGYSGGYYNLDITEFVATDEWLEERGVEPGTSYVDHLLSFSENSLAYDRRFHKAELEKARNTDVGSAGLAASHINNRASSDRVTQPDTIVKNESLDNTDVEIDTKTESVAPAVLKSERTWTASDYVQARDEAAKDIAKAIGVTEKKAKDYIDSINSIAKMIAEDRVRLDYFSSPGRSSFVGNVEYGGSFDFSTLCKKRRLLTGTFTAIQKALPDTALTANEILDIRNRMKDAGLEVSCGLCYVEGSRANMGQFAKEFLKLYKQYYPDAWQPNMADVNTPDGIEWVRINHPECYEQYEYFWNHYGTLKPGDKNLFASQQKPKLYQLHTEYKGEILEKFNDDDNVEEKNLNGGIRLQSFSDFEIVHLIDTMQIIMDMSRAGLAGQAYTKVPNFAWALGDTGLKINLSLIAKGVDVNGKLIFDDVEGMPIAEAMKLRERYSKNVGTILVAFNDEQLMAAMADDRVDFIIPFHRSQWKKSQYEAMGLPAKTKDYTYMQNEKFIKPQYHEYRDRMVRDKATNYMPNEYWDFAKSGKENAESYLEMCARNNKRPKFYKLLQNNGDGSYSLKADGSTDGYWKLLIDFKMYDNEGNGSPQMPVKPEFNMDEATRMLNDYRGGHSNFPVAQGVVDEFVRAYKDSHKGAKFSDRDTDSVSNRALLANALEGLVKDETERNKIQEYKGKIDLVNAEERKLRDLNEQIKELSFAKGPRDTAKIRQLRDEATKTANRISIYDKQLLRLEASAPLQKVLEREKKKAYQRAEKKGKEALAEYKAEAEAKQKETAEKWRESRKKAVENRNMAFVRGKIKKFKAKLEQTLLQPTDRQYVPIDLIKAMVEVCELIDTDTGIYKADGSINKAQQKRDETKEKLQSLKDEYEKLKTNSDPIYAGEFDEMVYTYLAELRDKFSGKSIKDMSLDDLNEMYEILVAIDETLRDARKLIGWGDAETVYDAGDAIVAEQNAIQQKRKNGKRNAAQKAFDELNNLGLSPVRNVEKMSGYNQDSSLLKLFKRFEEGIRKKNRFVMESYKMFEELASSKEYDDAVYNEVAGKKYIDHNGLEFGLSKMQMMQAILSWEREAANMDLKHIQKGGFTFADLGMLRKGRLKEAVDAEYTHRVPNAVDLVAEFQETLKDDKWCQDYMAVARKFFNEKAKDAINETSISLKHRIIAKGKNYIPFEVDTSFVNMEITDMNTVQKTINGYGMLKDTKNSAPQPLYITGLNNIIDRHIDQVGNVYGLAIEVRNFNKVWNVKATTESGKDVTVNSIIEENWGKKGIAHIEQAVKDIQGSRVRDRSWLYDRVKSGYIGSTFLLNLSVVTKQNGSLFSATSMIKWRDPVRMLANLYWTMLNRKKISAEVDKYTATAWMRRQGMSDAEVYTLTTEAKKTKLGRWFSNAPAIINPAKWITARDHAVALSLWKYCKQDTAKKTGLTGTELLEATAKFYDEVIENTQSMTDVLHRPEIQKSGKILHESFAMFKTDLYQMAGQLHNTTGRFLANKTRENGKALGRTLYAVAMSAIWGSLMTTVFAMLRYKVNPYRDDDDEELTAESWLKRQLFGLGGDIMGYIFPVFGSEVIGAFESIMYGESEDIADNLVLTAINDLYTTMLTIGTSIKDGEMPDVSNMKKLVTKSLQCFGIPANNILRALDAIRLHAEDIANGEFLSFEAGVERTPANHIHRIIEAMDEGNVDVSMGLYDEALDDLATRKAKGDEYGKDELAEAKSDLKTALGKKYKTGDVSKNTATKILSAVFGMSKDDIYWQFDAWDYAKENESADDYAKYGDFYTAVETGKNLRFTIKVYTDNGVSTDALSGQITSHFKPIYSEMSKSKRAGLKGYLLNAYELCGISRADAEEKISKWEFEADHPELGDKITYTQYKRWEADGKPNGVTVDLFIDVAEFRDDGTSDSVKSQDEVKQYIMSVASDRQTRHALWCCFYKASTSPWR